MPDSLPFRLLVNRSLFGALVGAFVVGVIVGWLLAQ